jgi:hypothetical protein
MEIGSNGVDEASEAGVRFPEGCCQGTEFRHGGLCWGLGEYVD